MASSAADIEATTAAPTENRVAKSLLEYWEKSHRRFPEYQPFSDWATGQKTASEQLKLLAEVHCNLWAQSHSKSFRVDVDTGCSSSGMSIIFRRPERLAIYDVKVGTKLMRIVSREDDSENSFYLPDGGEPVARHLGGLMDRFFQLSIDSHD